ncbi:MAG: hypothetical protein WC385_01185 [Candidatus Paceibacterota bacterium]|jgi:hypothetical protein
MEKLKQQTTKETLGSKGPQKQGAEDGSEMQKQELGVAGFNIVRLHLHGGNVERAIELSGIPVDNLKVLDGSLTTSVHEMIESGDDYTSQETRLAEKARLEAGGMPGIPKFRTRDIQDVAGKIFNSLSEIDSLSPEQYQEAFKKWGDLMDEVILVYPDESGRWSSFQPSFSQMGMTIAHSDILKDQTTEKDIILVLK